MNTGVFSDALARLFRDTDPLDVLLRVLQTAAVVFVIFAACKLARRIAGRLLKDRFSEQRAFAVRKGIKYAGMIMTVLVVFKALGIDTSALLGAAGVAGIVLGFAAQTSMSSFISGLFLLSEKPFRVGDTIRVEDISGVVLSVDLLSVKLRTFDNLFVRIPNETIVKTNLTTVTRFPIRRLDLTFAVAYKEDLERVRAALMEIAAENSCCLKDPPPFLGIDKFDSSGIGLIFCLWFEKSDFWNLKNSIIIAVKRRFEAEHIEIPYQKIDISINRHVCAADDTKESSD
jgi:small-conductance mechanosensitive channel